MANYTTEAKVIILLTGVSSVNTQFLNMADNIINSKLSARYVVPFTTVPPIVETIATDLAAYYCMRTLFTDDSQNKSEWVATFKESMKMLDDIAKGLIPLISSTGVELAYIVQSLESNNQNYNPTFDMDSVDNSEVDPDLIDAIKDSKE